MDLKELPRAVRAELRSLPTDRADEVGAYLLMAGKLIDTDPASAYAHAEAARRRAARLPVVREATAEAAYAAGEYAVALSEFRALRRMNGGVDYVAAMADCERALGHPDKALKLIHEALTETVDFNQRVELRLVEAGARQDLGQGDEALRLLRAEIEQAGGRGSRLTRARLRYGYADALETAGDADGAERWFAAAASLDTDGETDAQERVEKLQGIVLEIDEDAFDDGPESAERAQDAGAGDEADGDDESTGDDLDADEIEASDIEAAQEGAETDDDDEPAPASETDDDQSTDDEVETSVIAGHDVALFDLDGVIYLGPNAVEGAHEGVEALKARGVRVVYVTNNAARSGAVVAGHLTELGFPSTEDDLVTSAQAAQGLLERELEPGSKVLVSGTQNLIDHVIAAGMVPVTSATDEPVAVIQGYDPQMTWPRLDEVGFAVQNGATWYATNTDSTRPTDRGLVPGAGAAIAAVRSTVNHDPIVVGKPHRPLLEEAVRRTGAENPIFVGDRIDTDIQGARRVGMDAFMVFTGAHGKRDLLLAPEDGRPTAIGWNVPALLDPPRVAQVRDNKVVCRRAAVVVRRGRAEIEGPLETREQQLDALWALAQAVWARKVSDWSDAVTALDLIP